MKKKLEANIWKYYLYVLFGRAEFTVAIIVLFYLANNLTMYQVMILETVFTITLFLVEVPSGIFADKYGRKLSLALSGFFLIISYLLLGFGTTLFIFILARLFDALFWGLMSGSDSAFVYDTLKELKREKEYSKVFGRGNTIWMFLLASLSIIGAYLSNFFSFRELIFISCSIVFIGFLISLTFKEPKFHKKIGDTNYISHLKAALSFAFNNKKIRNLMIYYTLVASFSFALYFLIQAYYGTSNVSSTVLGIGVAFYFVFGGIGSMIAHKLNEKVSSENLLIFILLFSSLLYFGIFLVNPYFSLGFIALLSLLGGIRDLIIDQEIHDSTESHHRATIISIKSLFRSVIYAIFAPLIGLIVDIYTPSMAFLMIGIVLLVFLFIMLFLFKFKK